MSRDELIESTLRLSRRTGAQTALFSQAVADRLGLASSDLECLDVLETEGRLTVGRLAELLGLTTGSTTRMIDRLEQAGYVRRIPDPADRRRVQVEAITEKMGPISALHDSLRDQAREALSEATDDELQTIATFLGKSVDLYRSEAARLREPASADEEQSGGGFAAPLAGVKSGKLVFLSGAPRITVRGDPQLVGLYRADFVGPVPRMRVRGGVVTVSYPRFGWFDWRTQIAGQFVDASAHWQKDYGDIALNTSVPWGIELRGGISTWSADLRAIQLQSIEVRGGASKIDLQLPAPVGRVPIEIKGGISDVSIVRPAGTATQLEVRGGIGDVTLDGQTLKGSGRLSVETTGAGSARDRYEIEVAGGAAKLEVSSR